MIYLFSPEIAINKYTSLKVVQGYIIMSNKKFVFVD